MKSAAKCVHGVLARRSCAKCEAEEARYSRKRVERRARILNDGGARYLLDLDVTWYVGFVATNRAFAAQRQLDKWGAKTYLPLKNRWRRINRFRRGKVQFAYPALSGMLFFGLTEEDVDWYSLNELGALDEVLSVGQRPHPVDGPAIKRFLDENPTYFDVPYEQRYMKTNREFEAGEKVRITEGPFAGFLVEVTGIKEDIAHIVLSVFGHPRDVDFSLDQLEAVD